jgi:hypothetical protein
MAFIILSAVFPPTFEAITGLTAFALASELNLHQQHFGLLAQSLNGSMTTGLACVCKGWMFPPFTFLSVTTMMPSTTAQH